MAGILTRFVDQFRRPQVDWEQVEETLIRTDIGVHLTMEILDELQEEKSRWSPDEVMAFCRQKIAGILPPAALPIEPFPGKPKAILVIGVNGTGKTTSIAKLAHHLQAQNHPIVIAAADTFRAAAVEQLQVWGERLGIEIVSGAPEADPAAVCFQAYERAWRQNAKYLICDTAGRLHTRHNLMEEMKKIGRTLAKKDDYAPHETLLVVDATTGGNALAQAREFHQAMPLSGIIVTKMDGSGQGGCLVAIQRELGIPTRFLGYGESVSDFVPFDPARFIQEML